MIISSMSKNIAIAGAGISGMSTAFVLSARGYRVTIYAKDFSPNITSNKAAAFWFPYHVRNDKRGIEWCNASYRSYLQFAQQFGRNLCQLVLIVEYPAKD
jgi:D-amino-acid oxidase